MRELPCPVLAQRTTIRLGGTAIAELVPENEDDVFLLPERLRSLGGEPFVMGAGSNILAQDGELPLVLVRPAMSQGPEILGEQNDIVLVRAGCAVPMPRLLRFCAANGLSGLEGLVGIPGTVGGAVAMNAGSFGTQTCEKLLSFKALVDNSLRTVTAADMHYGYRSLKIFETISKFLVLEATFGLTRAPRGGIDNRMSFNFFEKKSRQPVTAKSAGCIFKNPVTGVSAGKLLDQAGFRGKRLGGMAFSELHANFLINEGKGKAEAAMTLIAEAQEAVLKQSGHRLELEVRVVPWPRA